MEKQVFQFGDEETSDIKLHIIGKDGGEGHLVYLHSQVLKKSEFYEARLSERWCLEDERPLELKIRPSVDPDIYVKCFRLMYSCEAEEGIHFSDVDEALAILPAVSEMLFHEGIQKCMEYLEAVRWSPEQETKLRAMLSSLQINILPDLAARLSLGINSGDLGMLKQILKDMLSTIPYRKPAAGGFGHINNLACTEVEQYIVGYFEAANAYSAKDVAETCRSALWEKFLSIVEKIKYFDSLSTEYIGVCYWGALSWLFDLIRRCDGKLYETCILQFCEDSDLSTSQSQVGVQRKLDILLDRILYPMANGQIITPRPFRVYFITKWLGEMVRLTVCLGSAEKFAALERALIHVADTLPLGDQKGIYDIWKHVCNIYSFDQGNATRWWAQKVQHAINHGQII